MRKEEINKNQSPDTPLSQLADIDIIDLNEEDLKEENVNKENIVDEENMVDEDLFREEEPPEKSFSFRSLLNVHTGFFAFIIICILVIVFRFRNWGTLVDLEEIFKDGQGTYNDTLDLFLPAPTPENSTAIADDVTTILCMGNSPFADDRDSEDNLANLIAQETGAVVYNCSIGDSYLAAQRSPFSAAEVPMDAYTLYWLTHLACSGVNEQMFIDAAAALGDDIPEDAQYVQDTLLSLDLNTVDVIAIMYDATDYLMGHYMYSDENTEDILYFTGNLEASINVLHEAYPHIQIIVMSPTYAYAINEEGEYVSSDMYRYGGMDVLSTYSIKEYDSCASLQVSFIDHLYGTITEDNASDYLVDHLHLNVEGRKLVAERFAYALNRYNRSE